MREHDALRRLAAQVEAELGPSRDVGWSDRTSCDLSKLRAAEERLARELLEHEDREKPLLTEAFETADGDAASFAGEIEKSHQVLAHLIGLMRTVSTLCDGTHVHALRTAVHRVREELESHLLQEERLLFPRLNDGGRKRFAKAH